jgi:acyl carrier protein
VISDQLKKAILDELDLQDWDLRDETRASEVPGWDSLRHIGIIAAVEKKFGIRFRRLEIVTLKCVGELQTLVDRKRAEGNGNEKA